MIASVVAVIQHMGVYVLYICKADNSCQRKNYILIIRTRHKVCFTTHGQ